MATQLLIKAGDQLESLGKRLRKKGARSSIVRRITIADCEADGWTQVAPVFVLSTGRCGTRLITELANACDGIEAHHVPRPELLRPSRLAWERIGQTPDVFDEVLKSAREEYIVEAARRGMQFVETNNRITFFAPAIIRVFPQARFVHLVRHPADVVRSGIRRNWYAASHAHDIGRIQPSPDDVPDWNEWSQIQKIGWMWETTNAFITAALRDVSEDRQLTVRSEDLFSDPAAASKMLGFAGATSIDEGHIAQRIRTPINAQRSGDFPTWDGWTSEQQDELRSVAPSAASFGYDLSR